MSEWRDEMEDALNALVTVAQLANDPIALDELEVEYLNAPHLPPSRLPAGKMAVYAFWGNGEWLKIGKVGAKSSARYTYQHYNAGSAMSTFAASLCNDPAMLSVADFHVERPGEWIRQGTHRVNILLSAQRPKELLSLLEAFLHLRLRPRYEG